jgi:shikimate dehydrogenase
MRKFGLIGYPLEHSFSRKYFKAKFRSEKIADCFYIHFPLQHLHELNFVLLQNPELEGLNVTIPYKTSIIPYLDELDPIAERIHAVNTIRIIKKEPDLLPDAEDPSPVEWRKNLILRGYNTDISGFELSLQNLYQQQLKQKPFPEKSLILGTGGASKAVAYVLHKLGIEYCFVSRSPEKNDILSYQNINASLIKDHLLIINTSPVGMFPDASEKPGIPYDALSRDHVLYDLIYNPEKTEFLKSGELMGAHTINGMEMLRIQAEKAWEIWNKGDI